MLPRLTEEQNRRRRVLREMHNILIIVSIELALAVYLVFGYIANGFTVEWIVSVVAFNYMVITVLSNWRWFVRRIQSKR